MKMTPIITAAAIAFVAVVASAQQPRSAPPRQGEQVQQGQQAQRMLLEQNARMERMRNSVQQCDQLQNRARELNQWMEKQGTEQGLREMGRHMEETGDRLQLMLRKTEQLCQDPAIQRDRDRMRDMDRFHDRLRTMLREMDEAHEMLRKLAGA